MRKNSILAQPFQDIEEEIPGFPVKRGMTGKEKDVIPAKHVPWSDSSLRERESRGCWIKSGSGPTFKQEFLRGLTPRLQSEKRKGQTMWSALLWSATHPCVAVSCIYSPNSVTSTCRSSAAPAAWLK